MSNVRQPIHQAAVQAVLLKSKRRCCLCFVEGNDNLRVGAIAHVYPHSEKNTEDNLVFLCNNHHAEFDRGTIAKDAVTKARTNLYKAMGEPVDLSEKEAKKPWRRFENYVQCLLTEELKDSIGENVNVYSNRLYLGRSGRSRQIDISAELVVAGFKLVIAVEVKHTKRKIGIQDIESFASLIQDIGANKGVLVTNTGFSESALSYARSKGIALVKFDEDFKETKGKILANYLVLE